MEPLKIGEFGQADIIEGKLVVSLGYSHDLGKASLSLELGLVDVMKLAAAKSDNKIDDTIVLLVAEALK